MSAHRTQTHGQRAREQEERTAAIVRGGRVQPGSGSGRRRKGDVRGERFLGEMKQTAALSYGLKRADLRTIERQAFDVGKLPFFGIEFLTDGAPTDQWIAFRLEDVREVLAAMGRP